MSAFIRYVPMSLGGGGGGSSTLSMGTFDGQAPAAQGATITLNQLFMQSADATHPGLVNIAAQTLAGVKTFSSAPIMSALTASQLVVTDGSKALASQAIGNLTAVGTDGIAVTNGSSSVIGSGTSLAQHVADTTHNGYLSSTDWNTFNGKQGAGNYITALTGDVTATGPGSVASTVAKIQGTTVSGTTGSTNVVFSTAPTMSNPVVGTQSQGDGSTKAASTAYVDVAVANAVAGINPAVAVQAATTAAGDTSGFTYNNGVSGVGATFTGTVNTAVTIDGYTFTAVGQRLLVKNDTQSPSGAFNGIYYVTQVQTGILPPILTRALDYNSPSSMNNTGAIPVINGTANGTTSWVLTSLVVTVGTTPLTFTEFTRNPSDYLLKANNLSDVASSSTSFNNISGMTTLGDMIYGGTSGTRSNLSGSISASLAVLTQTGNGAASAAPAWSTGLNTSILNAGTLPIARGGTNVTSVTTSPTATSFAGWDANSNLSANNFLAGYTTTATAAGTTTLTVASTEIRVFTGSTTQTCTLPVASTLVLGLSFTIVNMSSGVVTVQSSGSNTLQAMAANTILTVVCILTSGTGTASWTWTYGNTQASLPMINPMTTGGDLIYGGASGAPTRLANGSAGQYLQSAGSTSAPVWTSITAQDSWVGVAGYGSTTNCVALRWTTHSVNSGGSDITFTASASNGNNGDKWTINTAGVYSITGCIRESGGGNYIGISRNGGTLTSDPSGVALSSTGNSGYIAFGSTTAGQPMTFCWTGVLAATDTIQIAIKAALTFSTSAVNITRVA